MKIFKVLFVATIISILALAILPIETTYATVDFQDTPPTETETPTPTATLPPPTATATLPPPTEIPGGARPVIVLGSYSTGEVIIGQEFSLGMELRNTGQLDAYNVIVTFQGEGLVPSGNGGVQSINRIGTGATAGLSQRILVSRSLIGQANTTLTVNISYTDINGSAQSTPLTLLINLKGVSSGSGGAVGPTRTPTAMPRPQLIIASYKTDIEKLQAGNTFTLAITIQNKGNVEARNVTMVLGGASAASDSGGTPQPGSGGVDGGSADLTKFAPMGTSNVYAIGNIAPAMTLEQNVNLVVNVSTEPGAYPFKISFIYYNTDGSQVVDDQVITLLVYNIPNLSASFYQPVFDFYAGQPGLLPIQITNLGKRSIVLGEMEILPSSGTITSPQVTIGLIDPGGYFTYDAEYLPEAAGQTEIKLVLHYTDDFTQPSVVELALPSVNVMEAIPMEPMLPEGENGLPSDTPALSPYPAWVQLLLGFLGLTGG